MTCHIVKALSMPDQVDHLHRHVDNRPSHCDTGCLNCKLCMQVMACFPKSRQKPELNNAIMRAHLGMTVRDRLQGHSLLGASVQTAKCELHSYKSPLCAAAGLTPSQFLSAAPPWYTEIRPAYSLPHRQQQPFHIPERERERDDFTSFQARLKRA